MTSGKNLGFHRYNPEIHHRRSIRLQNFDYSQPGYYFITLCIHDRWLRLFGNIVDGKMKYTEYGKITAEWIGRIPGRFPGVTVDSWVVMPNHVHMIVDIHHGSRVNSGVGAIHELPLRNPVGTPTDTHELPLRNPAGTPTDPHELPLPENNNRTSRRVMTVPIVIGYYRMNTAKRINVIRNSTGDPVWQRNYWEHVIRDNRELFSIRQYINRNPLNWERDKLNSSDASTVREEPVSYGESEWMA